MRLRQINRLYPIEYAMPLTAEERTAIRKQAKKLIQYMGEENYKSTKHSSIILDILQQLIDTTYKLSDKQLMYLHRHYLYTWRQLNPDLINIKTSTFLNKKYGID